MSTCHLIRLLNDYSVLPLVPGSFSLISSVICLPNSAACSRATAEIFILPAHHASSFAKGWTKSATLISSLHRGGTG